MSEPVARTVKEFCRAYGIGKTKAYELIGQGQLGIVKVGRRTLILEASGQRWMATLQEKSILPEKLTGHTHKRQG